MTGEAFARSLLSLGYLEPPAGAVERRLVIAGLHLRLIACRSLADSSLRALAHHTAAEPRSAPDLTIFVLDRDTPGNPLLDLLPAKPASGPATGDRVERWCYEDVRGMGLLHEGFRALFLWNRDHGRAAVWLGEADELPYHLVALPLLPILSWVLAQRGLSVVHAAAIAIQGGTLLVGGRSGTGKSTAALACLNAGLGFLGDDMCIIEPGDPPMVHSLFCSAKLDVQDTARFPALTPALVPGSGVGWEKAVYIFDRHLAAGVVRCAPLLGVAIPRRGDAGRAMRLSVREGFLAMAPNTVFQLPGAARAACAGVKEVVSRVPVCAVSVGDTIEEIPVRLSDFARSVSPSAALEERRA